MDVNTMDSFIKLGALIVTFLTMLYSVSQRAARKISEAEAAAFVREVKWAINEESDEGSRVTGTEALRLIAMAADAYLSPAEK